MHLPSVHRLMAERCRLVHLLQQRLWRSLDEQRGQRAVPRSRQSQCWVCVLVAQRLPLALMLQLSVHLVQSPPPLLLLGCWVWVTVTGIVTSSCFSVHMHCLSPGCLVLVLLVLEMLVELVGAQLLLLLACHWVSQVLLTMALPLLLLLLVWVASRAQQEQQGSMARVVRH